MRAKLLHLAAIGAALGIGTSVAQAQAQTQAQGSWATKAPLPAALNEVTVAAVGGKIHVIGGSVLGFTGPYHLEYDPADRQMDRARAAPEPARSHRQRGPERKNLYVRRLRRRRHAQGRTGRRL